MDFCTNTVHVCHQKHQTFGQGQPFLENTPEIQGLDKQFFNDLVQYMTSEPVVVQVLQSEDAVTKYREVMGATNPDNADEGTIRKIHALNIQENSVHGSDSVENALKEISFFFNEKELVG